MIYRNCIHSGCKFIPKKWGVGQDAQQISKYNPTYNMNTVWYEYCLIIDWKEIFTANWNEMGWLCIDTKLIDDSMDVWLIDECWLWMEKRLLTVNWQMIARLWIEMK